MDDSAEALQKDSNCHKSREHLNNSLRTLELVQPSEIETLLETIISVRRLLTECPEFLNLLENVSSLLKQHSKNRE